MKRFIGFVLIMIAAVWSLSTVPAAAADALLSLRGGQVKLGGELELEFISSQNNDASGDNLHTRFSIDKVVLSPQVAFTDAITFKADIESEPDHPIKVDEAWVVFKELPLNTFIKVGLEDIFIKPHRKTEDYPINGYAFFQDEDLGLHLGGEINMFYWRASVTNGRRLADRRIQEDNVYPIIHDDDTNVEGNNNKEIGLGAGVKFHFKEEHEIDVLPFIYVGELSDADVDHLQGISTYGTSTNNTKKRYGLNVEYILRDLTLFAQYIKATDGSMDRTGWYIQPSYKVKFSGRTTFTAVEFLFRYDDYDVDLPGDTADSRTWDREKIVLAAITDVAKNLKIKTEYYINNESAHVGNNELLVQLEAKF
ncbi:MAG: hypothetical protein ACE5GF_09250 [Thermodesulfobacteriota bacterium]